MNLKKFFWRPFHRKYFRFLRQYFQWHFHSWVWRLDVSYHLTQRITKLNNYNSHKWGMGTGNREILTNKKIKKKPPNEEKNFIQIYLNSNMLRNDKFYISSWLSWFFNTFLKPSWIKIVILAKYFCNGLLIEKLWLF